MISISALTYKHFSFDLEFKYVYPFSQHYSEITRSKMVNIFFSASLLIYILSGTHMHRPEYRMGVAHPMVIIRSLCIVLYLQYGLYSTIYSVSADIFMQEDTVKRKGLPKHTTQHTSSLQLTFSTVLTPHCGFFSFQLIQVIVCFFLFLTISPRTFSFIHSRINHHFLSVSFKHELRWRLATAVPKHNLSQSISIVATLTQSPWGNKRKRKYSVRLQAILHS